VDTTTSSRNVRFARSAGAPAAFLERDHEPTSEPCHYRVVLSDATGGPVIVLFG
jgi:hypothetical protein